LPQRIKNIHFFQLPLSPYIMGNSHPLLAVIGIPRDFTRVASD